MYRSRKFIAAMLALVSAHWCLFEKLVTSADFKAIVLGTVGLYIAGNVTQKAISKEPK